MKALEMEKERRKKLASLPFSEKIKILEKLRSVSDAASKSGLRKQTKDKLVCGCSNWFCFSSNMVKQVD